MEEFESMLTGGHPNSLGRTIEVVDLVLADRDRHKDLYLCYFSKDEIVRLRVSNAMRRVADEQPAWTMDFIDGLQSEIAAIDQPSTQWTLAILFDLTRDLLSQAQMKQAKKIMKDNLANHQDWIVLNNTMKVLSDWSEDDPQLKRWLKPHFARLKKDKRKSVAKRALQYSDRLFGG